MRFISALICAMVLANASPAGPIKNLIDKLRPNKQPTQVLEQQHTTKTVTRERSLLRRQLVPAVTPDPYSDHVQPASSLKDSAPAAPAEAPADVKEKAKPKTAKPTALFKRDCGCLTGQQCTCGPGCNCGSLPAKGK